MKRAVVYVRISDDRVGAGLGVARQEADCRKLCDERGWTVADVISDNDRSAYTGKRRPGYDRLIQGLVEGRWDVVVAWHPDRLHRSPKELERFIDVLDVAKVPCATVTAGLYDLSTPGGRMTARVAGAVAKHESEHKADRVRRKHQEIAELGGNAGGGPAFGFLADRVTVNETEAALIREAAQAVVDGESLRSIVARWNAAGVRTSLGNEWSSFTLKRLLTSARVGGWREHGGKRYRAVWPPILDDVTWRRVRAVLTDPARNKRTGPRAYLLTGGLARCGRDGCGANLVARPRQDRARAYVCASPPNFRGCGKIRILAEPFEEWVSDRVLAAIHAGRIPQTVPGDVSVLLAEIDATEAAVAELAADYYAHRTVTKPQFQSASAALDAKLADLRGRVAQLDSTVPIDPAELERWDHFDTRRGLIARMVEAVWVDPAVRGRNFFDPDRVRIDWVSGAELRS